MNTKTVMIGAWKIAKQGAERHGGKASEYIAESLKMAWAIYKNALKKKGGKIIGFAKWFLQKKFGHPSAVQQVLESKYIVKKETEKAYLIDAVAHEGGVEIKNTFWAPKSVCI